MNDIMGLLIRDGILFFAMTALAAVICLGLIPAIIRIAKAKHLFDLPDGIRKFHSSVTPNLGGVAIFVAVLFTFSVSGYALQLSSYSYLVGGLIILFLTGLKDDILIIAPSKKLFGQILASMLMIWGGDLVIRNLGGIFGMYQIPEFAGILLTLFTFVVVINAYNLIDGIDGLAGGIGVIASTFFGIWFYSIAHMELALLAFIMAGALLGFLKYNYSPASIFMGDSGSQIVGFLLCFLALSFLNIGTTPGLSVPFKNAVPVLAISVLIVPLYDTLRVFIIRTINKRPFFKADRRHIHHQLLGLGFSHREISLITYIQNLTILGLTLLLADLGINMLLGIVLLTSLCIFPTFNLKRNILKAVGFTVPYRAASFVEFDQYSPQPTNGNGSSTIHKEEYKEEREVEKLAV